MEKALAHLVNAASELRLAALVVPTIHLLHCLAHYLLSAIAITIIVLTE